MTIFGMKLFTIDTDQGKIALFAESEDHAKVRLIEKGYQVKDSAFEKALEEMFKSKK